MKRIIHLLVITALICSAVLCGCSDVGNNTDSTNATDSTDTTVKTTGEKIHVNDFRVFP